jgi:hypothetical protein
MLVFVVLEDTHVLKVYLEECLNPIVRRIIQEFPYILRTYE